MNESSIEYSPELQEKIDYLIAHMDAHESGSLWWLNAILEAFNYDEKEAVKTWAAAYSEAKQAGETAFHEYVCHFGEPLHENLLRHFDGHHGKACRFLQKAGMASDIAFSPRHSASDGLLLFQRNCLRLNALH